MQQDHNHCRDNWPNTLNTNSSLVTPGGHMYAVVRDVMILKTGSESIELFGWCVLDQHGYDATPKGRVGYVCNGLWQ